MATEVITQVKRTIWVAECPHYKAIHSENIAKERYCTACEKWIPYVETSYTGPPLSGSLKNKLPD